ncbi:MAG: matrixin family metalloprotease [Myxococcota bacterium]|nr:matrixin family metalloprotease [Myxococcota bacterium]
MITTSAFATLAITLTAWNPTGFRWSPGEFPISYCITANGTRTNANATSQRNAVESAINAWRSTGNGGGLSCTTYDAQSTTQGCATGINLRDGRPNFFWERNWAQGSSTLGVTHYVARGGSCGTLNSPSGNINLNCTYDGDIEFNDATTYWTADGSGGTDITSIAVHEYGHFIGLGHCDENGTCNRGRAVMYSSYPGGVVRVPFNDDVQGACSLYPGTPGGIGFPCTSANQCTSGICIDAGSNGYCSDLCGSCPQGYACEANPSNPSQQVCIRDDGTNKDLCEICSWGLPNACANSGVCLSGLPETDQGRCATPCPNPNASDGACPNNYTCVQYSFQGGGGGYYCIPKSSDCTDLNNFTELQLGQACNGNPPCAAGLTCIGICSQSCTTNPDKCPAGFACETFNFQSGAQSYCAPPVTEGQNCDGIKACTTGPCLLSNGSNNSICYRECTGNPNACNNAQSCVQYTISGRTVGLCEPPGVPPRIIDAGIPGASDTGIQCPCDTSNACEPNCDCDNDCSTNTDAGTTPGPGTNPGDDNSNGGACTCDQYFYCESGCDCDLECPCTCDQTYACDLDENGQECTCDGECYGAGGAQKIKGTCSGCNTVAHPKDTSTSLHILLLISLAAFVIRRRVR